MAEILIVGDSFAAPHQDFDQSWYDLLSGSYQVVNRSQAGIGQFKIKQQMKNIPASTDLVLCLVTSQFRVHCARHPFYPDPQHRHHHADLIYTDINSRLPDRRAQHLVYYFKEIWDKDYYVYLHDLILEDQRKICTASGLPIIMISFFPPLGDHSTGIIDFSDIAHDHPGPYNHLSPTGHAEVYDRVKGLIEEVLF